MASKKMCKTDVAKVEKLLKSNELTPKQFAEELGHSPSWYKHIVDYEQTISITDVKAIKAIYGVDVEYHEPEIKEPTKDNADVSSDAMKKLDLITDSITQFSKNSNDADLDVIERLEKLEKTTSEISISLRTIGNLLTQINEKVMRK